MRDTEISRHGGNPVLPDNPVAGTTGKLRSDDSSAVEHQCEKPVVSFSLGESEMKQESLKFTPFNRHAWRNSPIAA